MRTPLLLALLAFMLDGWSSVLTQKTDTSLSALQSSDRFQLLVRTGNTVMDKLVYEMACLPCHQPDAKGVAGIYPPLAQSDWVAGSANALIRIVLHGLAGPITVLGKEYGGAETSVPMPAFGALTDQQIADVLTYVRGNFGNNAPPTALADVQAIRSTTKNRVTPWMANELSADRSVRSQ